MQFLGRPVSPARLRCQGGGGNENGQARAKPAGSNAISLAKRALRLLPPKRIPPRSSPRGRNAWAFAPAQDARRKEWRTRNAPPPHRWTRLHPLYGGGMFCAPWKRLQGSNLLLTSRSRA